MNLQAKAVWSGNLTVAVDTSAYSGPGANRGYGRYTATLINSLESQPGVTVNEVGYSNFTSSLNERWRDWPELLVRSARLSRNSADIYHSTGVYQAPLLSRQKFVCSVQDLIQYDRPEYKKSGIKTRAFHKIALNAADAIVTQASYTRERILSEFPVDPAKIHVVPLPVTGLLAKVGTLSTKIEEALPDSPFVVALHDLRFPDPHKRFNLLVLTAQRLSRAGVATVLIGAATENLGSDGIVGLGRLSDEDMLAVYQRASCYLYTTSYEGQGLPPQEAMLVGTPTVAVSNSCLPEMLGSGAVFTEEKARDEEIAEGLTEAVVELLRNPEELSKLGALARSHIQRFTPDRFLERLLTVYGSVL